MVKRFVDESQLSLDFFVEQYKNKFIRIIKLNGECIVWHIGIVILG